MLNKLVEAINVIAKHFPGMHYTDAVAVSVDMLKLSESIANEAAADSFANGRSVGEDEGYARGVENGRKESQSRIEELERELSRLRWMESEIVRVAKLKVSSIVTEENHMAKIANIKALREEIPGISLKHAKDVVDEYTANVRKVIKDAEGEWCPSCRMYNCGR